MRVSLRKSGISETGLSELVRVSVLPRADPDQLELKPVSKQRGSDQMHGIRMAEKTTETLEKYWPVDLNSAKRLVRETANMTRADALMDAAEYIGAFFPTAATMIIALASDESASAQAELERSKAERAETAG